MTKRGVFLAAGAERHWQLRQQGVLWSLAVGASLKQCVREVSNLYTRALRSQPKIVGISKEGDNSELLSVCDRGFVLVGGDGPAGRFELPKRAATAAISRDSDRF